MLSYSRSKSHRRLPCDSLLYLDVLFYVHCLCIQKISQNVLIFNIHYEKYLPYCWLRIHSTCHRLSKQNSCLRFTVINNMYFVVVDIVHVVNYIWDARKDYCMTTTNGSAKRDNSWEPRLLKNVWHVAKIRTTHFYIIKIGTTLW